MTEHDEILALHRQLAAEKLRADLAETRAAAKSRECIELRERMAARPPIPSTPEQAIGFIGDQFEAREDAEQPDRVRFQLTVHDLLSAFAWWFDEAEPECTDGSIYEAVSRRADPAGHAAADAEAQAMLGNWCEECVGQGIKTSPVPPGGDDTCETCGGSGERKSVTITEKGPWQVSDWGQGRIVIQSDDFTHDVALEISGDFGSVELERAHAEEIARRLNGYRVRPYTFAVGAAAESYFAQFPAAHPLPAQWSWSRLWYAMEHAAVTDRDLYTCIGKGGTYEHLGPAVGAGTSRGTTVRVYRDIQTGQLYYRTTSDFVDRMVLIEGQA